MRDLLGNKKQVYRHFEQPVRSCRCLCIFRMNKTKIVFGLHSGSREMVRLEAVSAMPESNIINLIGS